ncbi:MAG: response regulator [Proteobacteria bacterium]|nr:response regulator [Pseudomonadota bacterium]
MRANALVVDDEVILLDLLENILEQNGYVVTRATDGDQAIKVLNAENFDLVITDLQMGQTSGFDVVRKAKDTSHKTIVMMITGCYEESCKSDAFHFGADYFLQKPFSISDLLERIQVQKLKGVTPSASPLETIQKAEEVSEIFPKCKAIAFPEQHYRML